MPVVPEMTAIATERRASNVALAGSKLASISIYSKMLFVKTARTAGECRAISGASVPATHPVSGLSR